MPCDIELLSEHTTCFCRSDSSDARLIDSSGYTMVEEYINSLVTGNITAVKNTKQIPVSFSLKQNYPNPFNPTTKIEYSIPVKSNVKLIIFDLLGREVVTLVDGEESPGNHSIIFDGSKLSSGVYIYSLFSAKQILSKKMILLK